MNFALAESVKDKADGIADAVRDISPLSEGVEEFTIKPTRSVKEAMRQVFVNEKYDDGENFDDHWVGESASKWEGDTSNWGSATMKEAYDYVINFDFEEERFGNAEDSKEELRKIQPLIQKAKLGFKKMLGTGVMFGVAPMGAVQCGFTFPALAIVDPHSGKVYMLRMEGSGC